MAYAAVTDMVLRFGAAEMIRLTTPQDQDMTEYSADAILLALDDATDAINGYVGKRYQTPFTTVPNVIARAACLLARYDLSNGNEKTPSDQVARDYKATVDWLRDIASGKVLLPLDEVIAGDNSFAMMSDRAAIYGPGQDANLYPNTPVPNAYPAIDQGLTNLPFGGENVALDGDIPIDADAGFNAPIVP